MGIFHRIFSSARDDWCLHHLPESDSLLAATSWAGLALAGRLISFQKPVWRHVDASLRSVLESPSITPRIARPLSFHALLITRTAQDGRERVIALLTGVLVELVVHRRHRDLSSP